MIPFNYVPKNTVWSVAQGIREVGQRVTYTAIDKTVYNPSQGSTSSQQTIHIGRIALYNWTKGPDGKMQRKGIIEPNSLDPPMAREPREGDRCVAIDGQVMILKTASGIVFSDVVVAWEVRFESGGAR